MNRLNRAAGASGTDSEVVAQYPVVKTIGSVVSSVSIEICEPLSVLINAILIGIEPGFRFISSKTVEIDQFGPEGDARRFISHAIAIGVQETFFTDRIGKHRHSSVSRTCCLAIESDAAITVRCDATSSNSSALCIIVYCGTVGWDVAEMVCQPGGQRGGGSIQIPSFNIESRRRERKGALRRNARGNRQLIRLRA